MGNSGVQRRGAQGAKGERGADGYGTQGPTGQMGYAGSITQGPPGPQGAPGPAGAQLTRAEVIALIIKTLNDAGYFIEDNGDGTKRLFFTGSISTPTLKVNYMSRYI